VCVCVCVCVCVNEMKFQTRSWRAVVRALRFERYSHMSFTNTHTHMLFFRDLFFITHRSTSEDEVFQETLSQ
jgi:hypothetical protein